MPRSEWESWTPDGIVVGWHTGFVPVEIDTSTKPLTVIWYSDDFDDALVTDIDGKILRGCDLGLYDWAEHQ